MTSKKDSGKWQLYAVIVSVIFGILGLVVGLVQTKLSYDLQSQANSLTEKNLELQNILSNFTPIITSNPTLTALYDGGYYSNGTTSPIISRGWLNISITVITPHYGTLSVEIENFSVSDDYRMLDPQNTNLTAVTYTPEYQFSQHLNYVVSGLNQLNVQIPLEASFYPNPEKLPTTPNSATKFPIGYLLLQAKLLDSQTKQITAHTYFSSDILVAVMTL